MNRFFVSTAAVAVLSTLAATQSASAIFVRYNGVSPSVTVSLSKNYGVSYNNYAAGLNNLSGNTTNPIGLQGTIASFCIDINQSISSGNSYTDFSLVALSSAPTPSTPMGATKADQIAELWGAERASLSTSNDYAAFQVAIWEIVNDTGLSLTSGSFRAASSTVRTLAQAMLAKIDGTGTRANLQALSSPTVQDFVVPAIPAPGTAALGLIGVGLAARRRRGN